MVRNGVVAHPSLWPHGGYPEIQKPPKRYSIIDRERLIACCGFDNDEQLIKEHKQWVDEAILCGDRERQPEWSEAIAVGYENFLQHKISNFNL